MDLSWSQAYHKDVSLGVGTGLSDDAYVGIGYSTMSLLVLLVIACVLATVPILLCMKHKRGSMVVGGSNSFVISAACHIPILEKPLAFSSLSLVGVDSNQIVGSRGHDYGSYLPASTPQDFETESVETQQLLNSGRDLASSKTLDKQSSETSRDRDIDESGVEDVSQGPLRWGAVKMPVLFYQQYADMDALVGHLSFGAKEHHVEEPRAGHWYI